MFSVRAWWRSRARRAHAGPPTSWPSGIHAIPWRVLAVITAGGVIGALARQGIWTLFPHRSGVFDWATLVINVTGCALIGVLLTVAESRPVHRLIPPFLATGVLGGFTTFSTYIVAIQQSIDAGASGVAAGYLAGTLAAALAAVYAGRAGARQLLGRRPAGRRRRQAGLTPGQERITDSASRALQQAEDR